jgi:hypothetical protein
MDDARVKIVFEKETCRMVRGEMVLLNGFWIGIIYNLKGSTISDGCNSSIVPNIRVEEDKNPTSFGEKTMFWHQRLGHIGEKGLQVLHSKGMVEGMTNFSLDFYFYENCIYGKKKSGAQ